MKGAELSYFFEVLVFFTEIAVHSQIIGFSLVVVGQYEERSRGMRSASDGNIVMPRNKNINLQFFSSTYHLDIKS